METSLKIRIRNLKRKLKPIKVIENNAKSQF